MKNFIPFSTAVLLLLLCPLMPAFAQWSDNAAVNNAISVASGNQQYPAVISDGSGGAIFVWEDARGADSDIYAQRINASGAVQWTANGVAICTATNGQYAPRLTSDGSGGAIIVWEDIRGGSNYDLYAQRISAGGSVQWTGNGVALCTAANTQGAPNIVSDGSGGAIVVWHDSRGGDYDIYAQRIDNGGSVVWASDGVPIVVEANSQSFPVIESDGSGGALIAWQDGRSGTSSDLYAQRVDPDGAPLWTGNGEAVSVGSGNRAEPAIVLDGSGGAIMCWTDLRSGTNYDIYAQRVNASGTAQWTTNGEIICTAAGDQKRPAIISDGGGGAIITWDDANVKDLFAQRISGAGSVQWTANGATICAATGSQRYPRIVADGSGGGVLVWEDSRGGDAIYAQRINASATVQWAGAGVLVCLAANFRDWEVVMPDGSGGAIVGWFDSRGGTEDIYASRVFSNGVLPVEVTSFTSSAHGSHVELQWKTATEANNFGFEVERRALVNRRSTADGLWTTIGFVAGNGTSGSPHEYVFVDRTVTPGRYAYRIRQIDRDGTGSYTGEAEVEFVLAPGVFALGQNYPNPFNPSTRIEFTVPENGRATLKIFNTLGQEVATLFNGNAQAGKYYRVEFNASGLTSGLYCSRLEFDGKVHMNKMLLVK